MDVYHPEYHVDARPLAPRAASQRNGGMSAVEFVPLADVDDDLLAAIEEGRGWIPNVFLVLLHSPALASGWLTLANALRASSLDLRTRELAILLVAHVKDSSYEWGVHERVARSAGVTDAELAAIRAWPDRAGWSRRDWAVLTLVAAVAANEPAPSSCLDELRQEGARFTVELAGTSAYYVAVAQFTKALQVPVDAPALG